MLPTEPVAKARIGAGAREGSARGRRGRGRPKVASDAVRRGAIVAAACQLFLGAGYGGTTMDDVAAACRVSKRTLYRLFPGKADLFAAVVEAHRQSMLALPGDYEHLPLDAALEAIFRIDITPEADRTRLALLRLVAVEALHFPELAEMVHAHGGEKAAEALAAFLARQQAAGRIVIDDPRAMARILMDMVFGAILPKAHGHFDWPGAAARRAHVRRCIAVFLNGVAPRG